MTCILLSNKAPSENVVVTFDFSQALGVGETITSVVSVVSSVSAGIDAIPSALVNGASAINGAATGMGQLITGGLDNVNYKLTATVNTSAGQRLILSAILPVRA